MMDVKAVSGFLQKCFGNFWIFSLILFALEQLLDDQFICPCEDVYNVVICVLCALVPSIGCFLFTFRFADLSLKTEDGNKKESTTCSRVTYSMLTACVWLGFFFFDGRYLACALSTGFGVYVNFDQDSTGGIKRDFNWCKPYYYSSTDFLILHETLKWMSVSQIVSFSLLLLIMIILTLSYCCKRPWCHRQCHATCHHLCHGWCDYCRASCRDRNCRNRDVTQSNAEEREVCV